MDQRNENDDELSGFGGVRHRLRYRFDNVLARGTSAVLLWLGIVTVGAVLFSSLLLAAFNVTLTGSEDGSWLEDAWQSLLRVVDTGTMAGDVGWGRRLLALAVTIFGLLIAGTLIGVIAAGVEDRIDRMRAGRSVVIEAGHVVVLGASERLPVLIDQLILANRGHPGRAIVVMADRDPSEVLREVDSVVSDRLGTRLVFRSGDPAQRSDLQLVRLHTARTVIVLSDEDDRSDVAAVRTVLAVGAELGGFDRVPIVVELNDLTMAEKLVRASVDKIHPILPTQAIARTASLALRDPALTQVVDELLDFHGCDVYLHDEPRLIGSSFGDLVRRYPEARPIGRVRSDGSTELNPGPDVVYESGDRLVLIADDDRALEVHDALPERPDRRRSATPAPVQDASADHLLVVGWNDFGAQLITNWVELTNPDSTLEVTVDASRHDRVSGALDGIGLRDTSVTSDGDPIERIRSTDGRPYITTVVLLASHDVDGDEADARMLLELAALRHARPIEELPRFVVEVRDVTSVPLVELPGVDDYLVSDAVGSRFIAQLADEPERRRVYLELYDGAGPSLRLDSVEALGVTGEHTAGDIYDTVYGAGLTALGWRFSAERGGEIALNPHRGERVDLRPGDRIVTIG